MAAGLYPDSIIERALTELSYEGSSGVPFDRLWELLTPVLPIDGFYKKIIYAWLIKSPNVEVLNADRDVISHAPEKYEEIEQGKYLIRVTNAYQCLKLTGLPIENNPVSGLAYELLVEIAKSRGDGVDSLNLARTTEQDNRSLTTRIRSLSNLVVKIPILKGGRTLSLLTLSKFYVENKKPISEKDEKITINLEDVRLRIMNALKNAKHNIRQLADLRRELEMDKSRKIARNYKSLITYLELRGYLEKVLVVSPVPPKRQFLALKYLKDYVPKVNGTTAEDDEDKSSDLDDADDDEQELNDELIDDELKDLENEAPTSLANVENIEITSSKDSKHLTTFNRVYPLQSQIYQIVQNAGTTGLSSTDILDTVLGRSYDRLFSKLMECYTPDKQIPNIANHAVVRHYDFKGKTKFYRYFTNPNFLKFTNKEENLNGSTFLPYEASADTLATLNKKHFNPLNSGVSIVEDIAGNKSLNWFGQNSDSGTSVKLKKLTSKTLDDGGTTKKKRGRPKKGEETPGKSKKTKVTRKQQTAQLEEIPLVGELPEIPETSSPKTLASHIDTQVEQESTKVIQDQPQSIDPKLGADKSTEGKAQTKPTDSNEKGNTKTTGKYQTKVITVSDLKITSFKELERMNAIFKVLEDHDGVFENDFSFNEAVGKVINQKVDRRTFKKDLGSLIQQGRIFVENFIIGRETPRNYSVIALTGTPQTTIDKVEQTFKDSLKQQGRQLSKKSTLENVDLEFYDEDFKKSFETELSPPPPKKSKKQKAGIKEILEPADTDDNLGNTAEAIERAYKESQNSLTSTYTDEGAIVTKQNKTTKQKKKAAPRKAPLYKPVVNAPNARREPTKPDWDVPKAKSQRAHRTRMKRNSSNLTSGETMLLFKAVIICKTITKNLIDWGKVAGLFNGIPEEVLRKKWPKIRMLMGQNGGKLARRKWKRILLAAVKEGKISLQEVENLNLENLVKIWQDAEILGLSDDTSDSLFANYEDNIKHYNFVKTSLDDSGFFYDNNSMVQREQHLVNKAFTFNDEVTDEIEDEDQSRERATIRKTILAIILSGTNTGIKKLPLLGSFDKSLVDQVFVEMTKKKEILVNADTKVSIGEALTHILDSNVYDFSLSKVNQFQVLLKEIFEAKKGFVLSPVFDNSFMVPIIELFARKQLDLVRVDHYRREVLEGYEARILEREKLDGDIILTPGSEKIQEIDSESPLVPVGKPCSRVWINVEGKINKHVWNKVNRLVLTTILSQPGITKSDLLTKLTLVLNKEELTEILKWLVDAKAITEGEFQGVWLRPTWYSVFGVN